MKKLMIMIIITFLFSDCTKDRQTYLYIINNSEKTIRVYDSYHYPDTTFYHENGGSKIEPYEEKSLGSKNGWNNDIINNNSLNMLILYVFDIDSLGIYTDQELNEKYLKRYDLSLDSLIKMNWTVTYP
ncbi:MAG: hypothetical protein K8R54_11660 [Bacteroidales bacterium]|nr:hypothetical protein [Bacteroidales bacterium]